MPKIVKLSDCMVANNFSAAFWDDVNATPANFYKILSESDYKIIALYATKVINEHQVGISSSLKNKIVHYLKFLFTDTTISELFSDEEEKTCKRILQYIYCDLDPYVNHLHSSKIEMSDVLKIYSSVMKYKTSTSESGFCEEDVQTAKDYLKLLYERDKAEKTFFSKDERIQANIVMLKVIETAKKERMKEIEFLEKKMKTLLNL